VLGKLAAATAAGLGVLAPTVLGAHLLAAGAEAPRLLAATLLAVTVGSVLYGAGGVLLSLVTGRALVLALAYVLLWEGAAAGLAPSLAHASIRGRAEAAFDAALGAAPVAPAVVAGPVLMTLTASAVATWRLRRMDVA
jgi:hypothetical protein